MDNFTRSHIQRLHFKRRVKERARKDIADWSIDKIIVDIMMGRMVLIPSKNHKSYEVYETSSKCFNLNGYIVFDPKTEMLVTFLNEDMNPYIDKVMTIK